MPQNPRVSSFDSRWIMVEWQAPSFDGNSGVFAYNLLVTLSSGSSVFNKTSNMFSENVTNLDPFTKYRLSVSAINIIGTGRSKSIEQETASEGLLAFSHIIKF